MALIVEDGSIVTGANSYQSEADIMAYATARGVTLGDNVEVLAIKAMDYLESYRYQYAGVEVEPGVQPLAFPRCGVYYGGRYFPDDAIPNELKKAQNELVIAAHNGTDLMPVSSSEAFVTREKIDVIETEYSEAVELARNQMPTLPYVQRLLSVLLGGGYGQLRTVRI